MACKRAWVAGQFQKHGPALGEGVGRTVPGHELSVYVAHDDNWEWRKWFRAVTRAVPASSRIPK